MSKICSSCGKELDDSVKFCTGCGEKFEEPAAEAENVSAETEIQESVAASDEILSEEETAVVMVDSEQEKAPETEQVEPIMTAEIENTEAAPISPLPPDPVVNKKASCSVKPNKKITVGGVIGAILLCLFLVLNLGLSYIFAVGAGVFASDAGDLKFEFGGMEYSIESLLDFADVIEDSDTEDAIMDLLDAGGAIEIEIAGTTYEVEILHNYFSGFENGIPSVDDVMNAVLVSIDLVMNVVCVAFLILLLYIILVLYINVYSIYSALGKSRRAHIVSGVFFVLFSVAELTLSIIAVFVPSLLGLAFIESLTALVPAVIATFAVSLLTSVVGVILFVAGAFKKKK